MNKVLTIGLAAAALAGGVAANSGAALAADWNHGGYEGQDRYAGHDRYDRRDHDRYDHERYGRRESRDGRWGGGYRYREACRSYRTWSPYYGRYVVRTRCY